MKPSYEKQKKALVAEQTKLAASQERLTAKIAKNAQAIADLDAKKAAEDAAAATT